MSRRFLTSATIVALHLAAIATVLQPTATAGRAAEPQPAAEQTAATADAAAEPQPAAKQTAATADAAAEPQPAVKQTAATADRAAEPQPAAATAGSEAEPPTLAADAAAEPPAPPPTARAAPSPALLLGQAYPLEASATFHVALFHWLDSLTGLRGPGLTGGKTIDAHRAEYRSIFGPLGDEDRDALDRWGHARMRSVRRESREQIEAAATAFFETPDIAAALGALEPQVDAATLADMRAVLGHFAPRYERVWDSGRVTGGFLAAAATDPSRDALARYLVGLTRFYGVDPGVGPPPRLHLVPVIEGHGTHAQALGRHLLIEIRPGEGLPDEIAPIVHENAHLLFLRMDPARHEALLQAAESAGPRGVAAWSVMLEALPTALAQGAAARRLAPRGWSLRRPWYHREEVDAYAKRLLPLVEETLTAGGTFDEAFLRKALAHW